MHANICRSVQFAFRCGFLCTAVFEVKRRLHTAKGDSNYPQTAHPVVCSISNLLTCVQTQLLQSFGIFKLIFFFFYFKLIHFLFKLEKATNKCLIILAKI